MSTQLSMEVLREEVVAPAGHFAAELRKGQVLRIVDLKGQQVADLVTLNAANLSEKLSVMNTINLNKQVFPRVGYVLYSDEARGMTIIADTCGVQDMLAGACSSFTNCPIGNDGDWSIQVPKSKAGGHIDFHAEMGRLFQLPAGAQRLQWLSSEAAQGCHLRV
jgi:uncharacterized protein YcgI (DUF1989 family)